MGAGRVPPHVRKIEILGNQKALGGLRRGPQMRVDATGQMFRANCIDVVTKGREDWDETVRQIFVEFDLHRLIGVSTSGRSSWAEAAANAMAARTSSSESVGKSASISAVAAPSARLPS